MALVMLATAFIPFSTQAQTPTDKQLQSIETLMAPQRKKVTDLLEADRTGQYKRYKADLDAIAKENDPVRQDELVQKLERDHLAFIRTAYKNAGINNQELRTQLSKILGHNQFTLGEFADLQIDFTPPGLALPQGFTVELHCPMSEVNLEDNNMVASDCIAQGSGTSCSMNVQSLAEIAGGCRSKTSIGDKVELPEGTYSSITVATRSDISYHGFAFAVGGYGQVSVKFGVRLRAPGIDKKVIAKDVYALAPIVWFTRVKGQYDNFPAQAAFIGSLTGGTTVTAQAYAESFALSVPLLSLTQMTGFSNSIEFVRVTGAN